MFIDIGDGDVKKNPELRVCLNAAHADEADKLTWYNIGYEHKPIYLNGSGEPVECDDVLAVDISGGLYDGVDKSLRTVGTIDKPIYFEDGLPVECNDTLAINISKNAATATQADKAYEADVAEVAIGATQLIDYVTKEPYSIGDTTLPVYFSNGYPIQGERFLPLSAGEQHKISGPLGLTIEENYGQVLPTSGFEGEIFFVEDRTDYLYLPTGGISGDVLIKNSSTNGDASWVNLNNKFLPSGGSVGQVLMKNSSANGDASWTTLSSSYLPLSGGTLTGDLTLKGALNGTYYVTTNYGTADPTSSTPGAGVNGALYFKIIS